MSLKSLNYKFFSSAQCLSEYTVSQYALEVWKMPEEEEEEWEEEEEEGEEEWEEEEEEW